MVAGPPSAGETFPGTVASVPLRLRTDPKGFNSATGVLQRQIQTNPGVYVTLGEVGASGSVPKANTFYIKSGGPLTLRITTDDGVGGSVVAVVPIDGFNFFEFDTTKFLKLAEVSGSALIEYFASGQS